MNELTARIRLLACALLFMLIPLTAFAGASESRITAISDPVVSEGDAGTTNVRFEITCQCDFRVAATVQWRLEELEATIADNDYNDASGNFQVNGDGGIETYYVDVTVNGDIDVEPDERFLLALFDPSVGSPSFFIDDEFGVATILNDDSNADLSITKTDNADPVVAGQDNLTYTIEVSNAGTADATNVVVTDTLPAGVTLVSTTGCAEDPVGIPTCTLGNIANGASAQYTVEVSVDASAAAGSITNTASVAADEDDPDTSNNSIGEDTLVSRVADLSVSKTDSADPAVAGENLTYTITVDNAGPSDASGVVVTDTLPAGVSLVATAGCAEDPAGAPTCTLGTIAAGGSAQYTVEVAVDASLADGTVLTNNVSASANETDPDGANNAGSEGTTISRVVDITLEKSESIDPVVAGSGDNNLTYIVTATNNGPSDVTDMVISDTITLPANVTLDSVTPSSGSWVAPNWTVSIPAGSSETLTVVIDVPLAADEGTDVISDTATVESSGGGETFINNGDDSVTESTSIRWPTATFRVFKEYTSGDGGPVQVTLNCSDSTGLLVYNPQQGTTTTSLTVQRFDLTGGGTSCTVTEQVPSGYFEYSRTAECDVNPTADQGVYACTITNAPTRATFEVQKRYMDGNNDVPVTLALSCNTGLPLDQETTVFPDNQGNFGRGQFEVKFVVESYTDGELDCTVTEQAAPGYTGSYNCAGNANTDCDVGGPSGIYAGTPYEDQFFEGPCVWEDITADGENGAAMKCVIRNYPDPVEVSIYKDWVVNSSDFQDVSSDITIELGCSSPIISFDCPILGPHTDSPTAEQPAGKNGFEYYVFCGGETGPNDVGLIATVIPDYPTTSCGAYEFVYDDSIEVENGCESFEVSVGQGHSCTITNTVFFEGIPTLSQYGMAILALLMLGVGLVGFRRMA